MRHGSRLSALGSRPLALLSLVLGLSLGCDAPDCSSSSPPAECFPDIGRNEDPGRLTYTPQMFGGDFVTLGNCGGYTRKIRWNLSGNQLRSGFIVQKVQLTFDRGYVFSSDPDLNSTRLPDPSEGPFCFDQAETNPARESRFTVTYWEAWRVTVNDEGEYICNSNCDDTWNLQPNYAAATFGTPQEVIQEAWARFYTLSQLEGVEGALNNLDLLSGFTMEGLFFAPGLDAYPSAQSLDAPALRNPSPPIFWNEDRDFVHRRVVIQSTCCSDRLVRGARRIDGCTVESPDCFEYAGYEADVEETLLCADNHRGPGDTPDLVEEDDCQ
jgi:hypothetical protein